VINKPAVELKESEERLRDLALAYPEAYEEFPWGHRAVKVKGKTFVFIALDEEGLSLSTKLPLSSVAALALPFSSPTGYGLGKSGWVTARFAPGDEVPLELLQEWLDESYRAIAPKKLAARLPQLPAED
jgi:predicted DNA-binding protein (MmcQ/YjbR family)